jgi:FkbM family methyltransferase
MTAREKIHTDVGDLWYKTPDLGVADIVRRDGTWEPDTGKAIRAVLKEGDTFVDVGAHVGYFSVMACQAVGDHGTVLSFEPFQSNLELLAENLTEHGQACIMPFALGEATKFVDLHVSSVNSGDNRLAPHPESHESEPVMMTTLDSFDLKRVDVLKIDTQASDHRVMEGGMNTISRCRPYIVTEYWPEGLLAQGTDPAVVRAMWNDLDYDAFVIGGGPLPENTGYCEMWLEPR